MAEQAGVLNRSQPMTPLFTQVDQMIQASQNAQEGNQQQPQSSGQDQLSMTAV